MTMNRNYQKSNDAEDDPITNLGGLDHITKRPNAPTRIPTELSGISAGEVVPRPAPTNLMAGGFGSLGSAPTPPGTFAPTPSPFSGLDPGRLDAPSIAQPKSSWIRVISITGAVAAMVYVLSGFIGDGDENE